MPIEQQAIEAFEKSLKKGLRAGCVLRVHTQIVRTAFSVQTFGLPTTTWGDHQRRLPLLKPVSTTKIKVAGKKS
jgi:hypothetical protein